MPAGTVLQFRYAKAYISGSVTNALAAANSDTSALIAYIDQTPASTPQPVIVPVRFAKVVFAEAAGSIRIVGLQLAEFCSNNAAGAFNTAIRSAGVPELPTWSGSLVVGKHWLEIESRRAPEKSTSLEAFERTVDELVGHSDFATEPVFYTISGLTDAAKKKLASVSDGSYTLHANRAYVMDVFHHRPSGLPAIAAELEFKSLNSAVAITTNPSLMVRSRYDVKRVGLRVSNPPPTQGEWPQLWYTEKSPRNPMALISIYRNPGAQSSTRDWDFDLPIKIVPAMRPVLLFGAILGLALAAPTIATLLNSPTAPETFKRSLALVAAAGGIILGVLAAAGLRRITP